MIFKMLFKKIPDFTKRQWLTVITFSLADFCSAICVSLQAPFYPKEAEAKGCTATEYGLVFGIFELVVFLVSPIYGHYLKQIGPKFMFNAGTFTVGICAILFGQLDKVYGHIPFITFSLIIRIVEAIGNAAFLTASFAIIAQEFPDNVATTFASLETFFGLGLIVGPTVGGALYEFGGYSTPFSVLGACLVLAACLTVYLLPKSENNRQLRGGRSLLRILRIPGVMLASLSIVATSMSLGFLQATLEPHLRLYNMPPTILGMLFVVNGGLYALSAPFFGTMCDNHVRPKIITACGTLFICVGFLLIGPAPFIPMETNIVMTIAGLMLHGLGIGAQLVASFDDALDTTVRSGYKDDIVAYGLISGLWTSMFALGAFIGPTTAGILYDTLGFRNATMVISALHAVVGIMVVVFIVKTWHNYKSKKQRLEEAEAAKRENGDGVNGSAQAQAAARVPAPITIERPPGMNGIIARNSYKNRHGTWHMSDSEAVPLTGSPRLALPFDSSETRRLLDTHGV